MTGRPVNIADFRCRARKVRTALFSVRDANRSHGLKVVERADQQEPQESPVVFDIGMAREAQRLRRRAVRPISIHRHAQVIRFGEIRAQAVAGMRAPASWPAVPDGPYDLPPAA